MIIYKTTNKINGKIYVGKYCGNSKGYLGSGTILRKAIKKYGRKNFDRIMLEGNIIGHDYLCKREVYWIAKYNSTDINIGYNIDKGGYGGFKTEKYKEHNRIKSNKRANNYRRAWDNYCQYHCGKFLEEVFKTPETKKEEEIKEEYRKNIYQIYEPYCLTHFGKSLKDILFDPQTKRERIMKIQYCRTIYEKDNYIKFDPEKKYALEEPEYIKEEDIIQSLESLDQYRFAL